MGVNNNLKLPLNKTTIKSLTHHKHTACNILQNSYINILPSLYCNIFYTTFLGLPMILR